MGKKRGKTGARKHVTWYHATIKLLVGFAPQSPLGSLRLPQRHGSGSERCPDPDPKRLL